MVSAYDDVDPNQKKDSTVSATMKTTPRTNVSKKQVSHRTNDSKEVDVSVENSEKKKAKKKEGGGEEKVTEDGTLPETSAPTEKVVSAVAKERKKSTTSNVQLKSSTPSTKPSPSDQEKWAIAKIVVGKKNAMKNEKQARNKAKEEEKNWLEFRKKEILYNCRPSSAVAKKNLNDDSFPRKKNADNMGYGEAKSKYLALRPDPKYATWFGKKSTKKDDPPPTKTGKKGKQTLAVTIKPDEKKATAKEEEDLVFKKGNNKKNPLLPNGQPFWMAGDHEEELDDDENIVNSEVVEKVLRKGGQDLVNMPYQKTKFNVNGDPDKMKKDDILFDKKIIFSNTLRAVINLLVEPASKEGQEQPVLVKWNDKITDTSYKFESAAQILLTSKESELKNNVKT